jgi:tripartite-type tricarboxylate transporter receptor subunit TctC
MSQLNFNRLCMLFAAAGLFTAAALVHAQAFPSKIVRFIIPFPVGGSSDANGRVISPLLIERWGQQIIFDVRPGAASIVGTDYTAKSAPDGYTLLLTSSQYTQNAGLVAKLPFDPLTDLVPITRVTRSPQAIVGHPSLPAKNIRELVALARAHPGELNMGNAGSVLPSLLFNYLAKVKIVTVPYKGAGPMMIDAMGGHVPLAIGAISSVQGGVRAGRVRLLGVSSAWPGFPDAQVISTAVPGFDGDTWFGLFAPRGTPKELVQKIRDDVATVLRNAEVRQRLLDIGGEASGETPEEFTTLIRTEIARWKEVVAAAGLTPQ